MVRHDQVAPFELGIIGESGSGKTTLALAVLDLLSAEGDISIGGKRWTDGGRSERRALRRTIQVVFQDPLSSLSPRPIIEEIIGEGLEIQEPARVVESGVLGEVLGNPKSDYTRMLIQAGVA